MQIQEVKLGPGACAEAAPRAALARRRSRTRRAGDASSPPSLSDFPRRLGRWRHILPEFDDCPGRARPARRSRSAAEAAGPYRTISPRPAARSRRPSASASKATGATSSTRRSGQGSPSPAIAHGHEHRDLPIRLRRRQDPRAAIAGRRPARPRHADRERRRRPAMRCILSAIEGRRDHRRHADAPPRERRDLPSRLDHGGGPQDPRASSAAVDGDRAG